MQRYIKAVLQWLNSPNGTKFKVEPKPKKKFITDDAKNSALGKFNLFYEDTDPNYIKKITAKVRKPKKGKK